MDIYSLTAEHWAAILGAHPAWNTYSFEFKLYILEKYVEDNFPRVPSVRRRLQF